MRASDTASGSSHCTQCVAFGCLTSEDGTASGANSFSIGVRYRDLLLQVPVLRAPLHLQRHAAHPHVVPQVMHGPRGSVVVQRRLHGAGPPARVDQFIDFFLRQRRRRVDCEDESEDGKVRRGHHSLWEHRELEEADVVGLEELHWVGQHVLEEDGRVDSVENREFLQFVVVPRREGVGDRRAPIVPDDRARPVDAFVFEERGEVVGDGRRGRTSPRRPACRFDRTRAGQGR